MAREVCSWVLPPIMGQVVMVDPSGRNAEGYGEQSGHGTGYVRSSNNDIRTGWYRFDENTKNNIHVEVRWDNGNIHGYYLKDLLPFANKFKDLIRIEFNRGDSVFGSEKDLRALIDKKLINEGRYIADKKEYGEAFRTRIMKQFASKYKDILESGRDINEFQMATIEELIKSGHLDAGRGTVEAEPQRPPIADLTRWYSEAQTTTHVTAEQIGESRRILEAGELFVTPTAERPVGTEAVTLGNADLSDLLGGFPDTEDEDEEEEYDEEYDEDEDDDQF